MRGNWIRLSCLLAGTAVFHYGAAEKSAVAHKARMDAAQDASDQVQEAMDIKSSGPAIAASTKLLAFANEETAYWKADSDAGGVKLAEANKLAIERLTADLKAGNWKASETSSQQVQATCRACHDVHLPKRP